MTWPQILAGVAVIATLAIKLGWFRPLLALLRGQAAPTPAPMPTPPVASAPLIPGASPSADPRQAVLWLHDVISSQARTQAAEFAARRMVDAAASQIVFQPQAAQEAPPAPPKA